MFMLTVSILYFFVLWKKRNFEKNLWLLKLFALTTPLGFMAVEAGWVVTEVGRQPWILHGILRTRDAVTPMPGIQYTFYLFTLIYISLAFLSHCFCTDRSEWFRLNMMLTVDGWRLAVGRWALAVVGIRRLWALAVSGRWHCRCWFYGWGWRIN